MTERKVKIERGTYGLWARRPLDDRWMLEARLAREGDTLTIAEIRVVPRRRTHIPGAPPHERPGERVPDGGVPTSVLRKVTTSEIYDEIRRRLSQLADWRDPEDAEFVRDMWLGGARSAPRHPGRRGRDDLYYSQIAALYLGRVHERSPHPVVEVAKMLDVSYDAAVQLVHEARRRVLLTRPPPGRSGGELTPRAKALLGIDGRGKG